MVVPVTPEVLVGGATGMGVGVGILAVALGLVGPRPVHEPEATTPGRGPRVGLGRFSQAAGHVSVVRAAIAAVAGVVMFLVTGWSVGALLAALAAASLPRLFERQGDELAAVERMEAVAAWADMLRDTMAAAAGLEEAIISTAPVAPEPIRPAVRRLAGRLTRERLTPALHDLAVELDDPTADLVVTALSMAEAKPARDLGALLGALATSARAEVSMRRRVHAGRARLRTAVRVVTSTTLGFAALLVVFNDGFLAPYDDPLGQAWLLVVGTVFIAAVATLHRMARISGAPRLFSGGEVGPC